MCEKCSVCYCFSRLSLDRSQHDYVVELLFVLTNSFCLIVIFSDEVLTELKANRMVVGHTPQVQINAIEDGKAWRIDVGMSRGMSANTPEVLEIFQNENGEEEVFIITAEGKIPAEERYVKTRTQ